MKRTTARLIAATLMVVLVSGCLINGPKPPPQVLSQVRILPDDHLEAAPEGTVYELWTLNLDENFIPQNFESVIRFQWDPVNFRALDEAGEPTELYSPDGKGVDVGRDISAANFLLVTIEPKNDPNPDLPNGPAVMFYLDPSTFGAATSPLQVNREATLTLASPFGGVQPQTGGATFSMVAQTVQHQRTLAGEEVCWRDPTEGMGIWFTRATVHDLVREDTAGYNVFEPDSQFFTFEIPDPEHPGETKDSIVRYDGTLFTRDIDRNLDGKPYLIWIFPKQKELSFSNFDLTNPFWSNRTPDIVFRDGVALHPDVFDSGPPPVGPAMIRDGDTIGFIYLNPSNLSDTCFLRVDHPESTYCQSEDESIRFKQPSDTNLIIRQYTETWADTTLRPSLLSLPIVQGDQGGLLFEAWVVFDSAENPIHPPLSLGQIQADRFDEFGFASARLPDNNARYYDPAQADPNFHFPGEDFIDMSSRPDLPDSLDLLHFDGAEQIKVWITLEPNGYDWEPDKPWAQMVTYVAELIPDSAEALQDAEDACNLRGDTSAASTTPELLSFPLHYRPISTNRSDAAEGHNWPSMQIFLSNPYED